MARNSDLAKRVDTLEQRIAWLDEHGTRGVEGLRAQIVAQAKDISDNTTQLTSISAKIDAANTVRRQQYAFVVLSLLPVYVLLFLALFHVTPA